MSLFGTLQNIVEKTGEVVGGAVDGTVQVTTKAFSAVVDSFAAVSTFGKKRGGDRSKDSKGNGKFAAVQGFTSQLPSKDMQQFTSQLPSKEMQQFTAEEDPEVKRQREDAFRKAAAEAEKLTWQGRSWEDRRRETWSGQAERNVVGGGPVTYQQAILAQPMPMLSPLRGTNTPQGVRAIVDASVGTTTATFNPALGTPGVAIPSNATAGSLDASIKVNVQNTGGAPAGGVSSTFAAMFD
jgi:hypothetical protein